VRRKSKKENSLSAEKKEANANFKSDSLGNDSLDTSFFQELMKEEGINKVLFSICRKVC
jgi:hypothetical protein